MSKKDRQQRKKKRRQERLRQEKHKRSTPKSSLGDLPYWMTDPIPNDLPDDGIDDVDLEDEEDWDEDEEEIEDEELSSLNREAHLKETSPFVMERRLRRMRHDMKDKLFASYDELQNFGWAYRVGKMDCDLSKLDDPKEQAQELAYRSMESGDPAEIERLAREALKLDPACVDALVRLIPIQAGGDHDKHLELYRQAIEVGRRSLGGEEFFEENAEEFWHQVQTRPFMRALFDYGNFNFAKENITQAQACFAEMLALSPDDIQCARYPLLGCAFETGNIKLAKQTLKAFSDDETLVMRWAWVLERYLAADLKNARRALKRARSSNSYMELILLGLHKMPPSTEKIHPRSPEEAREVLKFLGRSWLKNPQAYEWFKEQCNPNPEKPETEPKNAAP